MAARHSRSDMAALRRRMQMIFQDPFASLNPRWRVFDIIAEPIRAFGLASDKADLEKQVGELLRQVKLTPADGRKYPARILGRPAPAHLDRPRARQRAGVPGVRRADLGARRLGAGADPQPDGRPAAPPAAHLSVHHHNLAVVYHISTRVGVMYLGRLVELAPTDDAVPPAQASLYADAARHDPRPRHDRPPARAGGGRGAEPDQPAVGLHLPSALPLRQRTLQGSSGRRRCPSRAARSPATRIEEGRIPIEERSYVRSLGRLCKCRTS